MSSPGTPGSAGSRPGGSPPGPPGSAGSRPGFSPSGLSPSGPSGFRRGRDGPPRWPGAAGRELSRIHRPHGLITALCFHVFGNWTYVSHHLTHPRDIIAWALLLVGPLALIWRRRAPIVVLAVAGAATIGYAALSTPSWSYTVAAVIALFTAVREGHRRSAFIVTAVGFLAYLTITWFCADVLGLPAAARPALRDAVLTASGLALTAFIGNAARARAIYLVETTKAKAERTRAREEQERRQAADERLRIARELHDVLGHHLSLINVQAGVGLHLMDNRPEQAREALAAIKTASSEALREVRGVLGVLRPEEEAAPRQPALGLDRLTDLTADAGLPVTTETVGERRDLPAEVDRAAYRIVQEALTNVRRHALPGAAATVSIDYAPGELRLTIRNDAPRAAPRPGAAASVAAAAAAVAAGAAGPDGAGADADDDGDDDTGGGTGIAGMRARAESLGGSLDAGPLPGGGYLVSAVLPTRATPRRAPA